MNASQTALAMMYIIYCILLFHGMVLRLNDSWINEIRTDDFLFHFPSQATNLHQNIIVMVEVLPFKSSGNE